MQKEYKPCSNCGKNPYIVNRIKWLCQPCNYERLHGVEQYKVPKQEAIKPSKKRKSVLDADRETYRIVFETHPNQCEECNCKLPDTFEDENGRINAIFQYSHIATKKAFPEFRNNPKNFNRLCLKCHTQWETGNRKEMNIYEGNMKIIEELKNSRL
jgi:hypothetical protein